jgi:putative molybdopterin biosynthesis protein
MRELMNTREVAEYLRIKERKVYELVRQRQIPCSRVGGKWLFPKHLIDLWLMEHAETTPALKIPTQRPPVVVGSHDPLLQWALQESGSELAVMFDGSSNGLVRFAKGKAAVCGCHLFDPDTREYNVPVISRTVPLADIVVIEWAWRDQGLIVASGNPRRLKQLADLYRPGIRFVGRQEGAGSRVLLDYLLRSAGLDPEGLPYTPQPARDETEVAFAVRNNHADAGLGIAAVVRQFQLDFVPLHKERYDLIVTRHDYFEQPLQRLLSFARSKQFAERANEMGGYDLSGLGRVVLNGD